jgi:hypothetical protein
MRKKLGDVFEVLLGDGRKAAFQYVANDSAQLGADVIQVSRCRWSGDTEASVILADLRMDFQVDFFCTRLLSLGCEMEVGQRSGHCLFLLIISRCGLRLLQITALEPV